MSLTMTAAVTLGNGGFEMIEIRRVPGPVPEPGEVRVKVLAAGVNNTDGSQVGTKTSLAQRRCP